MSEYYYIHKDALELAKSVITDEKFWINETSKDILTCHKRTRDGITSGDIAILGVPCIYSGRNHKEKTFKKFDDLGKLVSEYSEKRIKTLIPYLRHKSTRNNAALYRINKIVDK